MPIVVPVPADLMPDPPILGVDTQDTFSSKTAATLQAEQAMVPQVNALASATYQNALESQVRANTATTKAAEALASEENALIYQTGAQVAAAAAQAAAGLPSLVGNALKLLRVNASESTVEWASATANIERVTRTSNTQLALVDNGKLIDITSGTFTQTFAAAAALGNGWWCYLRNSGTGDITLDPNAGETIDGLTSFIMYPQEMRLILCDGVNLFSVVLNAFYKTFTASGNFVKPPGYSLFGYRMWSGGGSGSKSGITNSVAIAGAGGGCFEGSLAATDFAASETITVGAGGAARTVASTGDVGGTSRIGNLIAVFSGSTYDRPGAVQNPLGTAALVVSTSAGAHAVGFAAASTNSTSFNDGFYAGATPSTDGSVFGGGSIYGGAAGGSVSGTNVARAGGVSQFGGDGGAGGTNTSGVDGQVPAGGGGATQTGAQSGAGGRGEVRMWGII